MDRIEIYILFNKSNHSIQKFYKNNKQNKLVKLNRESLNNFINSVFKENQRLTLRQYIYKSSFLLIKTSTCFLKTDIINYVVEF